MVRGWPGGTNVTPEGHSGLGGGKTIVGYPSLCLPESPARRADAMHPSDNRFEMTALTTQLQMAAEASGVVCRVFADRRRYCHASSNL